MFYLYLAVGGVLGTLARYGAGSWAQSLTDSTFPWPTLAVNIAGSLLLGFLFRGSEALALSDDLRALTMVGFCGAFTTFSTFSLETVAMLERGHWMRAFSYSFGSLAIGLIAIVIGFQLASPLLRPTG